jgi:hypothetical protein
VKAEQESLRLLNLRSATDTQKSAMAADFGKCIDKHRSDILIWSEGTSCDMNMVADRMSEWAYNAATKHIRLTGGRPRMNANTAALQRRRRLLARLRAAFSNNDLLRCVRLIKKAHRCMNVGSLPALDSSDFVHKINRLRYETRKLIKEAKHWMKQTQADKWDVNRKATIHRMLNRDRPSNVVSIIDPITKHLEVEPVKLKAILQQGFATIFDCSNDDENEKKYLSTPDWYDDVYVKPKANINPMWYNGLMGDTTEDEVLAICSSCKYIVAPGIDKVSAGVWRTCVELNSSVRWALTILFNMCLRHSP